MSSVETTVRALLVGSAPIAAIVGQRVGINAAAQGWAPPDIVYTTQHQREFFLTGAVAADVCTIELQCWAQTAANASALADLVESALLDAGGLPATRQTGYDPELGLDAEIIGCTWVTG